MNPARAVRVVIDYYPAGTLTKPKDCYDGVVQRISDISLRLGYTKGVPGPVRRGSAHGLHFRGAGHDAGQCRVYAQFKPKEFDRVHVLYFHAHGPGKHTGKAVKSMDDLKGMKIGSTGNSASVVTALGGSPWPCPYPTPTSPFRVSSMAATPETNLQGWKMEQVVVVTNTRPWRTRPLFSWSSTRMSGPGLLPKCESHDRSKLGVDPQAWPGLG